MNKRELKNETALAPKSSLSPPRRKTTPLGAAKNWVLAFMLGALLVGCSSAQKEDSSSSLFPPPPPPTTDKDTQLTIATQAVNYFLEDVLGLRADAFKDEWKESFAQGIKGYINTPTPTLEDMVNAVMKAYLDGGNPDPAAKLTQAQNLELATRLPLESVCGLKLVRDGTNPPRYDVTSEEGWITLYYGDDIDVAVEALGESLEPYLANRINASFDPLKSEVVEEIKTSFGEAFRAHLAAVSPGNTGIVYKEEVHSGLLGALSALKK